MQSALVVFEEACDLSPLRRQVSQAATSTIMLQSLATVSKPRVAMSPTSSACRIQARDCCPSLRSPRGVLDASFANRCRQGCTRGMLAAILAQDSPVRGATVSVSVSGHGSSMA